MKRFIVNIDENLILEIDNSELSRCRDLQLEIHEKDKILLFLDSSAYLSQCLDLTPCIFSTKNIEHSQTLRTDGNWIWSGDLFHYTKEYYFQWPIDFVKNAIASKNDKNISEERYNFMVANYRIDKLLEGTNR